MTETLQEELKGLETFFTCVASHPPVSSCKILRNEAHLGSENIKVTIKATSALSAIGMQVSCGGCSATMTVNSVIKRPKKL